MPTTPMAEVAPLAAETTTPDAQLDAFAEAARHDLQSAPNAPKATAQPATAPAKPAEASPTPVASTPAPTVASPSAAAETAMTQTAATSQPAAPTAEKPAKPARAARDEATTSPAPTATSARTQAFVAPPAAGDAAGQSDAGAGGQPKASAPAEPALAETGPKAADPQVTTLEAAPPPQAAQGAAPAAANAVRGSPETVANFAAQIAKKLGARTTQFDVQLDPHGLGRVNVRVEINADGRVSAAMSFDNPQAAAELKSRSNELQRALSQSGFDLTGGLSFDVTQDQGGAHAGQQNAYQGDAQAGGQAFRGRAFTAALENAGDAAQSALEGALNYRRAAPSGVDVRI
jgi:hypothetical protein